MLYFNVKMSPKGHIIKISPFHIFLKKDVRCGIKKKEGTVERKSNSYKLHTITTSFSPSAAMLTAPRYLLFFYLSSKSHYSALICCKKGPLFKLFFRNEIFCTALILFSKIRIFAPKIMLINGKKLDFLTSFYTLCC